MYAPAAAVALFSDLAGALRISQPAHVDALAQTAAEFDDTAVAKTASADNNGLRDKVNNAKKTPYMHEKDAQAAKTNAKEKDKKIKKEVKKEEKEEDKEKGDPKTKAMRKEIQEMEKKREKIPIDPAKLTPTVRAWQVVNYMEAIWKPQFTGKTKKTFNND